MTLNLARGALSAPGVAAREHDRAKPAGLDELPIGREVGEANRPKVRAAARDVETASENGTAWRCGQARYTRLLRDVVAHPLVGARHDGNATTLGGHRRDDAQATHRRER